MDEDKQFQRRNGILLALFVLCLLCFIGLLYSAQVIRGSSYLERSSALVADVIPVESSRGIVTDRNGKVLISNRESYTVSFQPKDVPNIEGKKHSMAVSLAIDRVLRLFQDMDVPWTDTLPISSEAPFVYTTSAVSGVQRNQFSRYLQGKKWSLDKLTEEAPFPVMSESLQKSMGTGSILLPPRTLLQMMAADMGVDPSLDENATRRVVGVLYELRLRNMEINNEAYILAKDVSVDLISILNDGNFYGTVIGTKAVRQFDTHSAAHILGRVGAIDSKEELAALNEPYTALKEAGGDTSGVHHYRIDENVGKFGVEAAFEHYLHGINGKRVITTNEEGKITSEMYSVEPQPGGTVSLTIDIDFQKAVEDSLASAMEGFEKMDHREDRGGAVAVVSVKDSQVLALASYPTYDPARYGQDIGILSTDPGMPMMNRALNGLYAPGSTMKPCSAAAALESGIITPSTKILTKGVYTYWDDYQPKCWIYRQYGGTHGKINVSEAIYHSCNYFFYEVGRLMGIETLNEYASGFGLGQRTGIELPDKAGILDGPEHRSTTDEPWVGGTVLQCAIGQGDTQVTPLQLANYIATLLRGGVRYDATILKSVSAYDGSSTIYEHSPEVISDLALRDTTVQAIKKGMGDLASKGSVAGSFVNCPVSLGAKTGSAQVGAGYTNGLFVCFAPYDDPEIAVAIVVEKVKAGSNLAPIAADILDAYFAPQNDGSSMAPEGQLLP